jgi:hypothetical protein
MPNSSVDTYIVDGNITIFLGAHSDVFKQDIVYSSLLGQLVSNAHDIASDAWLSSYRKTLGTLYWSTKSSANQHLKRQSASVLKLAKPTLANRLSVTELTQLSDALGLIKNLPKDSDALAALMNRIQQGNELATYTVCPLLTVICANKTVMSLRLMFDTRHPVDVAILDEEISEKEALNGPQITQWITYLAEEKYVSVRHKIIEKLGSRITTLLHHITPAGKTAHLGA